MADLLDALRAALPAEAVLTDLDLLKGHSRDEADLVAAGLPAVVVRPRTTEQVVAVVKVAAEHRVPLVPQGARTGLAGAANAVDGGIVLSTVAMDRILEVDPVNRIAVLQPGVVNAALAAEVAKHGLRYPPDPGSWESSTIGGNVATNAGGMCCVKYGVTAEYVLGLEVVLASGEVLRTGRRTAKGVAGYDLTRLFVGSEGTLGIITEVTVRLYPVQEAMSAAVCAFDSVDGCTNTVIQTIQSGIPIARCDIVCDKTIDAINKYKKTSYRVAPTVFFEFHGSKTSVVEQAEAVQAIAKEHGGMDFVWATKPEERTQLWQARHDAYFACLQIRPGSRAVSTDVCVPISRLAECVHETMDDVKNYIAPVPLLGHIGDGNFHLMLLVDPHKPQETEIAKTFNKRLIERALRLEGTCTGEHGVGMGKMGSMRMELGDDVIDVMRDIKKLFDPENLMNPGKVVPIP